MNQKGFLKIAVVVIVVTVAMVVSTLSAKSLPAGRQALHL